MLIQKQNILAVETCILDLDCSSRHNKIKCDVSAVLVYELNEGYSDLCLVVRILKSYHFN